jgi:hypothetical protein
MPKDGGYRMAKFDYGQASHECFFLEYYSATYIHFLPKLLGFFSTKRHMLQENY